MYGTGDGTARYAAGHADYRGAGLYATVSGLQVASLAEIAGGVGGPEVGIVPAARDQHLKLYR